MKIIIAMFFASFAAYGQQNIHFKNEESLQSEIIRAINAKDKSAYIETFHPVFRSKLINKKNAVFNYIVDLQLSFTVPADYDAKLHEINPEDIAQYSGGPMPFPVPPSHKLDIEFNKTEFSQVSTFMWLSHDNYGWYQVMGIPTDEYLTRFLRSREKKRLFQLKINKYISEMDKNLYQEIVNILKNDKNIIKAHKHHMSNTDSNENFSIQVVRAIRKTEGLEW